MRRTIEDLLKGVPSFCAYPKTNQALGSGWNRVKLDGIEWDPFKLVDVQGFKVYLPPGIWRLGGSCSTSLVAGGLCAIYRNGSEYRRLFDRENQSDYGSGGNALCIARPNDYFEFFWNVNAGSTLNAGPVNTFFQGKMEALP